MFQINRINISQFHRSLARYLTLTIAVSLLPLAPLQADDLASFYSCEAQRSDGKQVLNAMQTSYAALQGMEAHFRQSSYMAALDTAEDSSGEVSVRKGTMRWDYLAPEPQTFLMREETMWLYQPNQKQVVIDKATAVLLSELPLSFLSGLGDLSKSFVVASACTTRGGNVLLTLKPVRKEDSALSSFALLVDTKQNLPRGAIIVDGGGNTTKILFDKLTSKNAIPLERFELAIPQGVDVIDRRVSAKE
jgi:outer membrane lipoprotein carrier protein